MDLALGLFFGTAAAISWKRVINSSHQVTRSKQRSKPCSHGHEKLMKHTAEFGTKVRESERQSTILFSLLGGYKSH